MTVGGTAAARLKLNRNCLQCSERLHSFTAKFAVPARLFEASPWKVMIENIVQFTHKTSAFKAFAKRRACEMSRVQMLAANPRVV